LSKRDRDKNTIGSWEKQDAFSLSAFFMLVESFLI